MPIAGTEHALSPKLSPDGDWIGFSRQLGTTERVLLAGGEPFEVCTSCWDVNGADDGNLYFQDAGTLYQVPPAGGDHELLSGPRPEQGLSRFARLHPLPGSRAILFENGNYEFGGIGVFSFEDDRVVHISPDGSEPFYSTTGHILFARRGTLFAVPFDAEDLVVTDPEKPVLQGVRVENAGAAQVALAANGTLVYQPAEGPQRTQLVWVDRIGQMEVAVAERKNYAFPRISPVDSKAAVVVNESGSTDIWIIDLATGSQQQLTTVGSAGSPTWTPDGAAVTFGAGSEGAYTLRLANAASGTDEELLASEHQLFAMDFTPDGHELVFVEVSPSQDMFVLDLDDGTRRALFTTEAAESAASLSADGKWLAYDSNRTGGRAIYVRQFPDGDEIQVSITAGRFLDVVDGRLRALLSGRREPHFRGSVSYRHRNLRFGALVCRHAFLAGRRRSGVRRWRRRPSADDPAPRPDRSAGPSRGDSQFFGTPEEAGTGGWLAMIGKTLGHYEVLEPTQT